MPWRLSRQINIVLRLAGRHCAPVLPGPLPLSPARSPHYHRAWAYHSTALLPTGSPGFCSGRTFLRQYSGTGPASPPPGSSFTSSLPPAQSPPQAAETRTEFPAPQPPAQYDRPTYELTFTCKPCGHRSTHVISKQAYHHGTTLVRCPDCKDRHIISDHLKVRADYIALGWWGRGVQN